MKRRLGPIFNAANDAVEQPLGKTSLAGLVRGHTARFEFVGQIGAYTPFLLHTGAQENIGGSHE
jgi:hypothetical protein